MRGWFAFLFAAVTAAPPASTLPVVAPASEPEPEWFSAEHGDPETSPALAFDGDERTLFRGERDAPFWSITRRFPRPFHVGAVRVRFGDGSTRAPAVYRWLGQRPVEGRCVDWASFDELPDGVRTDRDGNEFLHGPSNVHALRQAFFPDETLCALRLRVDEADGGAPAVHEIAITEGATAITRAPGVRAIDGADEPPAIGASSPSGVLDGRYETLWSGERGRGAWRLTIRLPEARTVDRLRLVLGLDAATIARTDAPGRAYTGAYLPRDYRVDASSDDDPAHLAPLDEADPPLDERGQPLPIRRRLVTFSPRKIQLLRLTITSATGPWGETDPSLAAPVVRDLELYAADDPRPVIAAPSFLVVDANPPGLAAKQPGGATSADGTHGRDLHHRLRRVIAGVDADTRWPADASRPRTRGTGRFVEVIEAGDPVLTEAFLRASFPPPITFLSGSFNWDYGDRAVELTAKPKPKWSWDPAAEDGGMGRLTAAVHDRATPFIGFCGGAQILALLDAHGVALERGLPAATLDAELLNDTMLRNGNTFIDGPNPQPEPYERAFWYDGPKLDASRPRIDFDPGDALFDTVPAAGSARTSSLELPSMHSDMVRLSAFANVLADFEVVATSDFCRPWVAANGPEETWTAANGDACVTVPQAFRSHDGRGYPVIGFQFHPEQRDLQRLASGMPDDARGDALNVFANAVDLAVASILERAGR